MLADIYLCLNYGIFFALPIRGKNKVKESMQVFSIIAYSRSFLCKFCIVLGMMLLTSSLQAQSLNNTKVTKCPAGLTGEALKFTNQLRSSKGLRRVSLHPQLNKSAGARSIKLARSQKLGHKGWLDSLKRVGFNYYEYYTSEIIAYGYKTAQAVINGWYKSGDHRRSLLNKKYNLIGIGCAVDQKGTLWWTQHFGG